MASVQEPEVQFAQRLASNEKPVRTRAIKKLRKYINVRSLKGGFTGDELLKLWKGLFYCLWMQDKPLLQEELSRQISGLIHSFQNADGQFLYVESFLQTVKREWTGIDRLRMDKFFQLVRFMFRQTFEMLQRTNWESSLVSRFMQLLTAQLLQSDSAAPSGLQFHVLDVYMTELAAVGSAELVADQNLTFIEPFCKTAAKTKDRTLFKAICSSIFSTIIDQAPFAIQDLMKELKGGGASDSDSGQASEEDDEGDAKGGQRAASNAEKEKTAKRQVNGKKINEEEDEEDDDNDGIDDDELRHLEELDSEDLGDDGDVGPVLQFDYGALAAKLLEQASRSRTPSRNRQRLYKIIKVLRDLSEGIFPQDEYPEEVSTDEDDDMFGSRKRMKRKRKHKEEEDKKEAPTSKKTKGKKKHSAANQQENTVKEDEEPADPTAINDKKKKKRKKKKKKKGGHEAENIDSSRREVAVASDKETEAQTQSSASRVEVTKKAEGLSDAPPTSEVTAVTEETSQPPDNTGNKKKKRKKGVKSEPAVAEPLLGAVVPPAGNDEAPDGKTSTQEDNLKKAEPEVKLNAASVKENRPAAALGESVHSEAPGKKKSRKKKLKAGEDGAADCETTPVAADPSTPSLEEKEQEDATINPSAAAPTPLKKTKKNQKKKLSTDVETVDGSPVQDKSGATDLPAPQTQTPASSGKPAKKKKRKIPVEFEYEADELQAVAGDKAEEETVTKKTKLVSGDGEPFTPGGARRSQRKSKSSSASDFITFQTDAATPTPLFCRGRGGGAGTPLSSKKVSRTPASESKKVTFGLKNNKTAEFRKTDRSLLVSPDGSSRVPFDPQQKPKFGVLKSPETPLSAKNRNTPNGGRKSSGPAPRRRPSAADFF